MINTGATLSRHAMAVTCPTAVPVPDKTIIIMSITKDMKQTLKTDEIEDKQILSEYLQIGQTCSRLYLAKMMEFADDGMVMKKHLLSALTSVGMTAINIIRLIAGNDKLVQDAVLRTFFMTLQQELEKEE